MSFLYLSTYGNRIADFDTYGYLFNLQGLTANSGKCLYTADITLSKCDGLLRILIGATTYYIPITTATNGG
jgi:hypothetical protein